MLKERTLPELGKRKDIMNEVNLLSQLDHPNVVRCEGFFRDESRKSLFIVLEYCPGGDLKSVIDSFKACGPGRDNHLDERLIWHLFAQICEGLKHLHEHGIVHRDLKAMNVMIVQTDTKFVAKIADLGVSRQLSDDTMMLQTFYGTPLYLSPELVENKQYNEKTDIWSLGVILYELICLTHPFKSPTLLGLAKLVCSGKYDPIPNHIGKNLARCVKWLLNVDFMKRPNIVQLLRYVNEQCTPGYPWKRLSNHASNDKHAAVAGYQVKPPHEHHRNNMKSSKEKHHNNNLAIDVENVDHKALGAPTADTVDDDASNKDDDGQCDYDYSSHKNQKLRPNLADTARGNASASGKRRGDNAGAAAPGPDLELEDREDRVVQSYNKSTGKAERVANAPATPAPSLNIVNSSNKNGDVEVVHGLGFPDGSPGAGDEGENPYEGNYDKDSDNTNKREKKSSDERPATSSEGGSRRSWRDKERIKQANEQLPDPINTNLAPAAAQGHSPSPSPNYRSVSGNDNENDKNNRKSAAPALPKQDPNKAAGIGGWDPDGHDFPTTEEMMQLQGFIPSEPLNPNARHISRNPTAPSTTIDSPNNVHSPQKQRAGSRSSKIRLNKKAPGLCSPRPGSNGNGSGCGKQDRNGYYSSVPDDKVNIVRTEEGFIGEADPPIKRGGAPLGTSAGQRPRDAQKKHLSGGDGNVPFKHDDDDNFPPRETTNNRGRDRDKNREKKKKEGGAQIHSSATGWAQEGAQLEKRSIAAPQPATGPAFTDPTAAPTQVNVVVKPKVMSAPAGPMVQVDVARVHAAHRRETSQLNKLLQIRDFMGNNGYANTSAGDNDQDSVGASASGKESFASHLSDVSNRIAVLKDRKLCLEQALDSARGASTVRMAKRDILLFPLLCSTSTKASIQQEKDKVEEMLAEENVSPSSHQRLKAGAHINTAAVKLLMPLVENSVGKDRISSMVQPLHFPTALRQKVASQEDRIRVIGRGSNDIGVNDEWTGDGNSDDNAAEYDDDRGGNHRSKGGYNGVIDHNRGGQARARSANARPTTAPSQRGRKENIPKSLRSPQAKELYVKKINRRGDLFVPSQTSKYEKDNSRSTSPSPQAHQLGSRSPSPIEVVLPSRLQERQDQRQGREDENGEESSRKPNPPSSRNPRHASNPVGHDANLYQQVDDIQHQVPQQQQQQLEPRHQKIELLQRNDWRGGDESNTNDYHRDQDQEAQKVYASHDRKVHYDQDAQLRSAAIQKPPRPSTAGAPMLRRRDMHRPGTRPSTGGMKSTYVSAKDAGRNVDAQEYEATGLLVRGLFRNLDHAYDSHEKLPPAADQLSKERAAIIDMFGFNANAKRRFHRQAPVSSGAAYKEDPESNQYVAVNEDGEVVTKKEPRGFRLY